MGGGCGASLVGGDVVYAVLSIAFDAIGAGGLDFGMIVRQGRDMLMWRWSEFTFAQLIGNLNLIW